MGKKRKSSARYRAFKKIKGVQLYVRITPRRRRRVAHHRRRRRAGFGCSSAYGCGFGGVPSWSQVKKAAQYYPPVYALNKANTAIQNALRFGQHGHYNSLGQIMSPYTAAPAPAPAAAFGRRHYKW